MRKHILIFPVVAILLFFSDTFSIAAEQVNKTTAVLQDTVNQINSVSKEPIQIIDYVEIKPQFPGGDTALIKWVSNNIQYPVESAEKGIQGRVVLRFVITPDGSIDDVEVVKSLDSLCNNEAIRVVKMMPKWIPAKQNGNPVYVRYALPVTFKLQQNKQVNEVQDTVNIKEEPVSGDSTQVIYDKVDVMPQFPGGDKELMKFLSNNMMYPAKAVEKGTQGRVVLRFIVTPDGSITNVEVAKTLDSSYCDNEAIRVVKMMPKWIPGKQNGNPVYVYFNFPILFRMENY